MGCIYICAYIHIYICMYVYKGLQYAPNTKMWLRYVVWMLTTVFTSI